MEGNKLVADRQWRDKSTANQEQARIVGLWRDKDQGMSMGEMMQSRESTLTNSNQRVNMGTCDELASTRTYFLQRHSHNCTAGAVWAGRTLSLSHRTRPYSRKPD